jgi:hypothetical protein
MDEETKNDLDAAMRKEGLEYAGFGLVYEKSVFSKLALRLVAEFGLRTICEVPANNLMGNNSDVFTNCEITRLTSEEDGDKRRFDLVWNFCEFEHAEDPTEFIRRLSDHSNGLMMVVTQNIRNPGVLIHRLYHLLKGKPWDHGKLSRMSYNAVRAEIRKIGFEVVETGAFDAPWFILDVYESGKFLRKLLRDAGTNDQNLKHTRFESWPLIIRSWLAHHHYVLFRKGTDRALPMVPH